MIPNESELRERTQVFMEEEKVKLTREWKKIADQLSGAISWLDKLKERKQ